MILFCWSIAIEVEICYFIIENLTITKETAK